MWLENITIWTRVLKAISQVDKDPISFKVYNTGSTGCSFGDIFTWIRDKIISSIILRIILYLKTQFVWFIYVLIGGKRIVTYSSYWLVIVPKIILLRILVRKSVAYSEPKRKRYITHSW
jgi:hypothetical protein